MRYGFIAVALAGAAIVANGDTGLAQTTAESAQPKGAPGALIPTEILAKTSLISGPELSPDGTRVLAMIGVPGKSRLGLIHVATGKIETFSVGEKFEMASYRWAGDGRVLISVGKTTPWLDDEAYMTRLIAYDVATKQGRFIGAEEQGLEGDDILYVDPDGKWLLLSIQRTIFDYPSVFRVDLDTAKMKEVVRQRSDVWEWYADEAGVVRAGVGFGANKWSLVYRTADGAAFKKAGSARYDDDKASLGLLRFTRGSDQGYVLSNEKTGRNALYRFNFATMELGELVFESPTNDVSEVVMTRDGETPFAAFYTDDRRRVAWFDEGMKKRQAELDAAVPGRQAWIISRSRDDSRMLVYVGAGNNAGSYFYWKPDEGVMQRLAYRNEALKAFKLSAPKPISYKARDGLVIHGYLTLPAGREPSNLPLIVMPHGGPFGVRDDGDFDAEVQLLANRGYAVLQPNYRGSDSYGREFEDKGTGQWGRAMQDDLDDGMDWLVKEGIADPKRVCLVGASYGGYAALWGATRNPERYRCAASFAGLSDLDRQLRYSRSFFSNGKAANKWRDRVRGASDFKLSDVSPLAQVDKLKVPVLLTHGDEDQRVPLKQSSLYARALEKAGKVHEYHVYKGEGHGLDASANEKDYYDRLEAFLKKHNPAD
jgi:dipeptidyl aminopeptidase/acylaminoacyl peptidase